MAFPISRERAILAILRSGGDVTHALWELEIEAGPATPQDARPPFIRLVDRIHRVGGFVGTFLENS